MRTITARALGRLVVAVLIGAMSEVACTSRTSSSVAPSDVCTNLLRHSTTSSTDSTVRFENKVAVDTYLPAREVRGCVLDASSGAAIMYVMVRKGWPAEERAIQREVWRRIRSAKSDPNDTLSQLVGGSMSGIQYPPAMAAVTDGRGEFRITGLPRGSTVLRVNRFGYADDSVTFNEKNGVVVQFALRRLLLRIQP